MHCSPVALAQWMDFHRVAGFADGTPVQTSN